MLQGSCRHESRSPKSLARLLLLPLHNSKYLDARISNIHSVQMFGFRSPAMSSAGQSVAMPLHSAGRSLSMIDVHGAPA